MDNEKFQNLMMDQFAKLFSEVQSVKTEITEVKSDLSSVKSELTSVKSDVSLVKQSQAHMESDLSLVKKSQARMESDFGKKLDALYVDWRETQKQLNADVMTELRKLNTKVEALQMESSMHDTEIKALKRM